MVKIDQILNEVQALKNRAGELIFLVSLSIHLIRVTVNKCSMFENIENVTITGPQYNLTGELSPHVRKQREVTCEFDVFSTSISYARSNLCCATLL